MAEREPLVVPFTSRIVGGLASMFVGNVIGIVGLSRDAWLWIALGCVMSLVGLVGLLQGVARLLNGVFDHLVRARDAFLGRSVQ